MATTQEDIHGNRDRKPGKGQANSESMDQKRSSEKGNVDNGENQVANGTQNAQHAPGIAEVGNTGAEKSNSQIKFCVMSNKNTKNNKTKPVSQKKKNEPQPREFETMSQAQNRHGKGRAQNGSDGSSNGGRGSNH